MGQAWCKAQRYCARYHRDTAGIRHIDLVMLGTGGKGRGLEAAKAIAALENEIKPARLHVNTLTAFAGTPLNDDILAGRFEPAGEREIYQEERHNVECAQHLFPPCQGV